MVNKLLTELIFQVSWGQMKITNQWTIISIRIWSFEGRCYLLSMLGLIIFTILSSDCKLKTSSEISLLCHWNESSSNWKQIANNILLIYDPENDYHPQYEGYELGATIKQADVILGGYPLLYEMNR